ncbi:hypothetical protein PHSY_003832 [Pseudozyma hubeiensis SY62]|uniref:Uncharacterized protein n=1 Tax=Pseudozyma hubeiensis (strain SY62) TaxID=1305764 RepID=R9P4T2_PSEHS|nr:hypothetical protein PHSY_003832 [Pseudozyma hubeiensis SY62]GAC96252.1 hypothetical protein PHSY_003832 [Pseudozyma hubeiensis SY62]
MANRCKSRHANELLPSRRRHFIHTLLADLSRKVGAHDFGSTVFSGREDLHRRVARQRYLDKALVLGSVPPVLRLDLVTHSPLDPSSRSSNLAFVRIAADCITKVISVHITLARKRLRSAGFISCTATNT